MIDCDELVSMRNNALATVKLKIDCAAKGHDHIQNRTVICNFKLIEMTSELLNFRRKFGEFEGIEK